VDPWSIRGLHHDDRFNAGHDSLVLSNFSILMTALNFLFLIGIAADEICSYLKSSQGCLMLPKEAVSQNCGPHTEISPSKILDSAKLMQLPMLFSIEPEPRRLLGFAQAEIPRFWHVDLTAALRATLETGSTNALSSIPCFRFISAARRTAPGAFRALVTGRA
jgi:hypothetical protein